MVAGKLANRTEALVWSPDPLAAAGRPAVPAYLTGTATRGCYKRCLYGWTDPDLTMPELKAPESRHGICCRIPIPTADRNPGTRTGGAPCQPFSQTA